MNTYYFMYSGALINPKHISSSEICLEDIAHHLTNIGRFAGSLPLNMHYSVAEHSILMAAHALSEYRNIEVARYALMHDASEAYLGDVVTAVKGLLPEYKCLEKGLEETICRKYGLNTATARIVKELDMRMLLTEAKCLTPQRYNTFKEIHPNIEPFNGLVINGKRSKRTIKAWFLFYCRLLNIKD